jgi:hypothetical protein
LALKRALLARVCEFLSALGAAAIELKFATPSTQLLFGVNLKNDPAALGDCFLVRRELTFFLARL